MRMESAEELLLALLLIVCTRSSALIGALNVKHTSMFNGATPTSASGRGNQRITVFS